MKRLARRGLQAVVLAALAAAMVPAGAAGAAAAATPAPSAQRQQELQSERRELQQRLARLKKALAAAEAAHGEAADALAASETAISEANRRLAQLAASRSRIEQRIAELSRRESEAGRAQGRQRELLDETLRQDALREPHSPLEDLLAPDLGAQRQRDRVYLERAAQERAQRMHELGVRRDELAGLREESAQRRAELAEVQEKERTVRARLLVDEKSHRETLAHLSQEIESRRKSVESLERDDARLSKIIDEIGRLLAEQERRRAAARGRAAPPVVREGAGGRAPEPPANSSLGRIKGKMHLPVAGEVVSRFGAPRRGDDGQVQPGAPAWKGVFLAAAAGTPVHAIAAGRVVFADWLRGFGNLVIVDHGDGFLSVYADNETLLRSLGEEVAADETIATVGNTGGQSRPGLYFELRYQGRAIDPLAWAGAR